MPFERLSNPVQQFQAVREASFAYFLHSNLEKTKTEILK